MQHRAADRAAAITAAYVDHAARCSMTVQQTVQQQNQ
jgi:hypothetical protein